MRILFITLFIIVLLVVSTLVIVTSVFADSGYCQRWNDKVSGENSGITKLSYPPCLTEQQGQRWLIASTTARVKLASLYCVEQSIAELYGAKYMKYPVGARWSTVSNDNSSSYSYR